MRYRTLGRTGLRVSEISLGAARPTPETLDDFLRTVQAAVETGVNLIDTAERYGQSEELLGEALRGRTDILISTKVCPWENFGRDAPWVYTPDDVTNSIEQSLRRLRRDYVDILYCHAVRTPEALDRWLNGGFIDRFVRARDEGKVRFLGMSEISEWDGTHEVLQIAVPLNVFDVVMLTYNMLLQTAAERVLPLCQQHGVGAVVMMPLNQASPRSGLVSVPAALNCIRKHVAAGHLPDDPIYGDPALFDFLLEGPAHTIPEAALRFCLARPEVHTVCVGTRRPERLAENLQALQGPPPYLPPEQLHRLRELFGGIRWQLR